MLEITVFTYPIYAFSPFPVNKILRVFMDYAFSHSPFIVVHCFAYCTKKNPSKVTLQEKKNTVFYVAS